MKKAILLSAVMVLATAFAAAQYGSQDSNTQGSMSSAASNANSNTMTVQGCLSGTAGNYTLTDKSGMAYQLSGNTSRLQAHVGHTISVTGSTTPASSTPGQTGSMSSSADSSRQMLMVTSFKHVSPNCDMGSH